MEQYFIHSVDISYGKLLEVAQQNYKQVCQEFQGTPFCKRRNRKNKFNLVKYPL